MTAAVSVSVPVQPAAPPPKRRVLVVEDSPTQAAEAAMVMEACGYEVCLARDAREARERIADGRFDLVLSDVLMPEVSGFELCRTLKSAAETEKIPVVLLTTLNEAADVVRGLEAGADGFVCKPYEPEYLAECVARIIDGRAAGAVEEVASGVAGGGSPQSAVRYLIDAMRSLERSRSAGAPQSNDALRRSEERFALAAAGANDVLWDWDLTTGKMYFSPRLSEITELEPEEFPADFWEWVERVHPGDRNRLEIELASHISGTLPSFQNEHRYARKNGGYRWVLLRGCTVRDANGKAYRIAGSLTDVHRRRQFEEQLLANTRELKLLVQSSTDLYLWLNSAGETIDVRSGTLAMLDLLPGAEHGRPIHDGLTGEAARCWREALLRREQTDREVTFSYEINEHNLEVRLIPLSGGLTLTVVRDVSDRTHRERQLAASAAAARASFEDAPVALAQFDGRARVLDANRALREMLGRDLQDLRGIAFRDLLVPTATRHIDGCLEQVAAGNAARCEESVKVQRRDGEPLRVRVTASSPRFDDSGVLCVTAVFLPDDVSRVGRAHPGGLRKHGEVVDERPKNIVACTDLRHPSPSTSSPNKSKEGERKLSSSA